jgi:iron(III) transport system permease protein
LHDSDLAAISVRGISMLIVTFAVVLAVSQIPVFGAPTGAPR